MIDQSTNFQADHLRVWVLLLWEWLKPPKVVTDTGSLTYFVVFIAMALTLSYFRIHYYISAPLKILFILYSLHALYYKGSFISLKWVRDFGRNLWENLGFTLGREWSNLSFEYQTCCSLYCSG